MLEVACPPTMPDLVEAEPTVVHLRNARQELLGRVISQISPEDLMAVLKLAQVFPDRLDLILNGDPTCLPHFGVFHPKVVVNPQYVLNILRIFIEYGSDMAQQIVIREGHKESRMDPLTLVAKYQCEAQKVAVKNPSMQHTADVWAEIRAMVLSSIQNRAAMATAS